MKPELYGLIRALGGILIATTGNIIALWISKRFENSKEIKRLVLEFSAKEWADVLEEAKQRRGATTIPPPCSLCNLQFAFISFIPNQNKR